MKLENTKAQMRKGILDYAVLLMLQNKESYPSELILNLKEAKMIVVEGTLYPLLQRLKNAGLLTYNWQESTMGPPRKYYSITKNGEIFLLELEQTWKKLQSSIQKLQKTNKK